MPPRKSTASAAPTSPSGTGVDVSLPSTATGTTETKSSTAQKGRQSTGGEVDGEKSEKRRSKNDDLGIDDLLLPRTLTSRLSRGTLPANTSIQRDALLALTKSATVFISYLAHNANNLTSRRTIQSQEVLEALKETELWTVQIGGSGSSSRTLGERVRAEVEKWEGEVRGKRKGYRDRVKARESTNTTGETLDEEGEGGRGPIAKRARRASDADGDVTMDAEDGEGDEDAAAVAAQLRGEEAAANGDGTETDPEVAEDEEEDEVEDEDAEPDPEDEDQEEADDDDDEAVRNRTDVDVDVDDDHNDDPRKRTALAPNGRVEVGSDDDESE